MGFLRTATVAVILAVPSIAAGQNPEISVVQVPDAAGQNLDDSVISVRPVGEDLYVVISEGSTTVGNMLVSIGEDGVLLVDDQMAGIVPRYRARLAELGNEAIDRSYASLSR